MAMSLVTKSSQQGYTKELTRLTSATMQALNSSYTKELATTSLWESNGASKVIIPPHRGMNQSQDVDHPITGRNHMIFSSEVHVLAGTLVPVVSTNTWWFGG